MFNIKKALLSALILSGLTVQKTQPMDPLNSSIKQNTIAILKTLLEHKGKTACCLLIGTALAYDVAIQLYGDSWTRALRRQYWLYNFIGIRQEEYLRLNNNQIAAIPENLNLPQLNRLHLDNNQIAEIPNNLNLPRLEWLNLNVNQIAEIPENLNLPQLQWLFLNNNQIKEIPENLNLPRLRWLHLDNNQIGHVDLEIFDRFPNLEYITLSRNPLTQNDVDALRNAAVASGRVIEIVAEDIGDQYLRPGINTKGVAKKR